jgi:hypothetical protein
MEFNLLGAWAVAAVGIVFMVSCGYQNKRSGWKRKRTDVILDSHLLSAEVQRRIRDLNSSAEADMPQAAHALLPQDLLALNRVTGKSVSGHTPGAPAEALQNDNLLVKRADTIE